MKSKFKRALAFTASLAMCGMTLLQFPSGTFYLPLPASAAEGDTYTDSDCTGTFDANGFCTEGGTHYEPAADTDGDGVYEIANAGQLYWFMELVNSVERDEYGDGYADYDAILTDDITVNETVLNEDGTLAEGSFREWFPIGYFHDRDGDGREEDVCYNGTFDGRGHTISGLYFDNADQDYVGLFGQINSGAEICNVTVADSYFKGKNHVGGVCGYNYGEITGCQNDATVIGTEYVGGICAANGDLLNCCANFGTIEGEKYVGGILGHNSYTGNSNEVRNCFSAGSVSGSSYVGGVCGWNYNARIVNCYFDCTIYDGDPISTEEYSTNGDAEGRTTEQCKSGEVAVLLGDGWGQELGVQDYPVPNGMPVYYGYKDCYSTLKTYNYVKKDSPSHDFVNGTCVYCGNTPSCVHPEYENGFCLACDLYEPATDVDNDGVYEIANAGQLYWFMELVNGTGQNTVDIDAVLTADITVNENVLKADGTLAEGDFRAWFPIGYYYDRDGDGSEESICYNGTFDGQGYTISGLYFDNAEQDYVGLFGQIKSGAEICNVTVADSCFKGKNYVGGVCGRNSGTITDSTNSGSANGNDYVGGVCGRNSGTITDSTNCGSVTGEYYVGGVCSCNDSGTITNSTNSGSVTGEYYVGGVCGRNSGTITDSTNSGSANGNDYVGGVCGFNNDIIINSTNSGSVEGGADFVGGVCGYNSSGTITDSTNSGSVEGGADFVGGVCGCNDSATITNSTNSGSVEGGADFAGGVCGYNDSGTITNSTNSGSVTGEYYVGGVCGYNSSGTITNSTNSGSVEGGADFVGGVCGYNDSGTITNSTNSGSVTGEYYVGGVCSFNYGTITNSTNSGSVAGEYSIGGVCSYNSDGTVTNCYYDSDVFTGDAVGSDSGTTTNTLGKTTAEFQSGEVAYLLSQGCTIDPDASVEGDEVSYSGEIWGQTIGEDTYPVLGGDKVYQCESECSGTFYSNTEGDAQVHAYVNGFCTNTDCEDGYQPASDTNDDGVYEIANAGQLYWFMELVNSVELDENGKGYADYDAILTANITVNENVLKADSTLNGDGSNFRAWFPIGYYYDRDGDDDWEDVYYNGTFDGQNHTISGLYFDNAEQDEVGLFGQIDSGAKICNVTVADSYFKGSNFVGGVCGYNYGTITNSTNSGSVTGEYYVGGVCGFNYEGTIANSTNSGSVNGSNYVGGVCGLNSSGTITNSTNSGSVDGSDYVGGVCGWNSFNITNCYYDSTVLTGNAVGSDNGTTTDVLGKTTEEFKSGEVAYLLSQGCTIDPDSTVEGDEVFYSGEIWGQTIGEDTYPVLGGDKVYKHTSECGGTFYSNNENDTKAHLYDDNGFCTNADCEDPYQPATDTDENGVYEIANGGQLYWFMELVNNYGERYVDIDAILTADITVNENVLKDDGTLNGDGSNFRAWFPIGYYYDRDDDDDLEDIYYNGTFDGQGYTISGLYFDNTAQSYVGLFGQTESGAEICNVTVADSCFKGKNYVGGVCGRNYKGTITDCTNSGSVTGSSDFVGGVCGYNDSGTITNSTNSGSVTSENFAVGGMCGYNNFGTITNSTNSGSVTGNRDVSGVCGRNYNGTITNSTNSGSVTGNIDVGGVCGYNSSGTITNCYYDSTVFTGNAVGSDNGTATDVLGKTTAEFQSGEVAYLLSQGCTVDPDTSVEGDEVFYSGEIWGQTLGEDTYPVLGGDEVYQCESECGGTFYSNTENDTKSHAFDANGFCINADCEDPYQPATDTDENGVYEIANAGQLYWFMEYVNANTLLSGGDTEETEDDVYSSSSDALLTVDITVNENVLNDDGTLNGDGSNFRAWFPIGYYYDRDGDDYYENVYYTGTFDGQGYTISGLYFDIAVQDCVGLFGRINSGAEICNVNVADSYFKGKIYVGGVCGDNYYGTIKNSTNSGSVAGEYYVGGVCGYNEGTIKNSTNSGSVTGTDRVGGVCGYNSYGTITNSTNSSSVTGSSRIGGVCGWNAAGTITNCYYDSTVFTGEAVGLEEGATNSTYGKTTAEFQSGEVAYLLRQGCTVDPDSSVEGDEVFYSGEIWGQTIDEETYPVLNGKKVIMCGENYVNAHLDPCECTPIDAELKIADEAAFVATYTYGDTIDITAEDFTTLSDPKEIEFTWQDAQNNSLDAPVNAGSYKLVVSIPQTYYNDILYAKDTLEIDITIGKAIMTAADFMFTVPENLTYDGSEKTATLTSNLDGIGEMTLTYYDENGEMLDGAPVNTGTYTVKADVAEGMNYQAASTIADENWTFTIGKADLTKADLIVIGSQYQVYDKNGNLFTVQLSDSLVGAGELTVTYADADGAADGINGAGTYTVTAVISEGENYNAARFDWTVTIYKSLLTGITVDVTAPEAAEVPQSTVEAGEGYTASIKWIPAEDAFGYNAAYTAVVTLTPDANHQFTDKSEITAEGFDITRNDDGTITLTRTYDTTAKAKITALTAPQDVLLEEHQPDAEAVIALLPTSVLIESENGTTELPITWNFKGEYAITANAVHTFIWTADCGDLDENGFDMTGTITVTNPDYTDISEQIELTAEDITYGMEPDVSAGYGENDAEISYSMDGETFDTLDAFLNENDVLSAGTYTVKAYYESETEMGSVTAEFTVNKAVPSYEIPTDLTATYGDTLADVELPESFKWEDAAQSVGNAGTNIFTVTFTPADTDNYEIIEGIEVEVEVAKAVPEVTPMIPEGEYFVGDALPEIGFNSAIGGLIQWITQLVDGLTQGENELEWQFTPEDTDNYEVVTGTAVVEAQTTTTTTTTTSETTTTTTTEPTTSTSTSTNTETTTSSTTTSTSTETTTSSTTTSTNTETTTSSTTTSTSTETTTSSTTTSTNTETTTSSTTTTTSTETTTSSTTTSTNTETTTSSTTTSTNTETTTSGTTTSTNTETTTSSTTTSTNTETTTSSTTTSTNTETTTSSTSTSTSTETTTSSTTTSTNTETTTSSTTTSTNTETTTSSTTTSTSTETTTSSTSTSTNTEPTTSSTSTSTTTTPTHIASDEELCDWAVNDYAEKTGVTPEQAEIEYTADGSAVITLTDAEGNVLDVYNIDPFTGVGTESDGDEVNLPQTGYGVGYNDIMLAAAAMVLFGIYAMAKSRKREEE